MTRRWRPPPYWPPPPDPNWTPPAGWQPDPSWPPPPPGWQFWETSPSRAPYLVGLAVLAVVGIGVAAGLTDDGAPAAEGAGVVDTVSTAAATTPPTETAAAGASEPPKPPAKPCEQN
jgi:hypothetical protein